MSKRTFIVDPSLYDLSKPVADIETIRKYNKQRYEMEQITAVVYEDMGQVVCVGYKDISEDEFWIRGHMPVYALMPGVIMCEVAAQLASYFTLKNGIMNESVTTVGFAGLDKVRFRGMVRPGDRLIMQVKLITAHSILITAQFVGLVGTDVVCEGIIKGVPLALGS